MAHDLLHQLGIADHPRVVDASTSSDEVHVSVNPTTNEALAGVTLDTVDSYERTLARSYEAFQSWRLVPAPVRGQIVREIANELRSVLEPLGSLVALEVGKIRPEGIGEVQETIDIADFAVGLSRQLTGITMPSERPDLRMFEQWLPLGPIGVITAFNFPNAVWGWNAMLAAVCGDTVVWKPSLLAPLTAIATNRICQEVASRHGHEDIFTLVIGTDAEIGERLIADRRLPLISATGSCRMGRHVGQVVAGRLGRCLLELGGNNAIIVEPDANLDLALKNVAFGAVGTSGQRCTTTRRLLVHESIADSFVDRLVSMFRSFRIGDPLETGVLVGPVINGQAGEAFDRAVAMARSQGGEVLVGGGRATPAGLGGTFCEPTIIRARGDLPVAREETFAPILYVFTYSTLDEAIALQNGVDQGLSSAIFTQSVTSAETFLSPAGSDCGLAYVNLGTSGAEIGGAFGGEKDTGGGRESGSDAWKAYMRRQTCTVNRGAAFKLAQGIELGDSL
ncbi:MAG: aldehyde dehydrogenase family protein [Phycisphaerales bacterium]|nr:aldehyde dehydrogenase family protein [Phycisphaerales bacterium]